MNIEKYKAAWQVVKPLMLERQASIVEGIRAKLPSGYSISSPEVDENADEFKVYVNVRKGDVVALGFDFILVDAGLAESSSGMGISMPVIGHGGLYLGGFFPKNWTEEVWTEDPQELVSRVEELDVSAFTAMVLDVCLVNPMLAAELAKAEGPDA